VLFLLAGDIVTRIEVAHKRRLNAISLLIICLVLLLLPFTKENSALWVDNGVIADGKITVAPGQTAAITLVYPKPVFVFTLFEGKYHYSTSFIK